MTNQIKHKKLKKNKIPPIPQPKKPKIKKNGNMYPTIKRKTKIQPAIAKLRVIFPIVFSSTIYFTAFLMSINLF